MTGPTPDEHAELTEFLVSLGVPRDDIPTDSVDAAPLAADVVLTRDDIYTLVDVAGRAGVEVERADDIFRNLGVTVADHSVAAFDDADAELIRFFADTIEILTEDEGRDFLHILGSALGSAAEASVSMHVQGPESRTSDWLENARLNATMAEVSLELGTQLAAAFRHHIRQSAQRQRRIQSELHREIHALLIGFVDLAGFTSLSQTLTPAEIVTMVSHFETRARELGHELGVRIVKLIGDEVMFAAEEPSAGARFAFGMLESYASAEVAPRGGMAAGDVVAVRGDYFGPVVNLAARLVDTAVPGEILVGDVIASTPGIEVEPAGRRMLRGFDDPVRVYSLLAPSTTERP